MDAHAIESAPASSSEVRRERARPRRTYLSTLARLVLAAVFATAALAKIGEPATLVRAVRAYQILPESLVHPVASTLPYLELAVALLLLLGIGTRTVAGLAGLLLILFMSAVASAGLRGLKIDCGCFGGGGAVQQTHYLRELARDSVFVLITAWLLVFPRSWLSVDGLLSEDGDEPPTPTEPAMETP